MGNYLIRKLAVCTLCIIFNCAGSYAQFWGTEAGFGLGASIYQGDLSPHWIGAYNRPGPSFQLMVQKNLFPGFAIRANYSYASISDNEENYKSGVHQLRNFSFEATINELSAHLLINPMLNNGEEQQGSLHPYFFGGIGISFTSIKRDFSRFDYSYPHWQTWVLPGLSTDSLKTLPRSMVTLPVGFGLRYQIGNNIALYGELTKRITRSEYLDGFSKSANQKENDGYSAAVVGLIFRFSSGKSGRGRYDCPVDVY